MTKIPDGFKPSKYQDPFEDRVGPFLIKETGGIPVGGFVVEERHNNGTGVAQGGFLLTYADFAIFIFAQNRLDEMSAVTVSMNADFTAGARPGDFLEARGEIVHETKRMVFVRGTMGTSERTVLNYSAILRKIPRSGSGEKIPPKTPTDVVPDGFSERTTSSKFLDLVGPHFVKPQPEGGERTGSLMQPYHSNGGGAIHGGALLALADSTLSSGSGDRIGPTVTISLSAEFLQPGVVGEFVEVHSETVRSTRGYEFIRGQLMAGDRPLLNYNGILKKFID